MSQGDSIPVFSAGLGGSVSSPSGTIRYSTPRHLFRSVQEPRGELRRQIGELWTARGKSVLSVVDVVEDAAVGLR
jgi:hypothetical protein